MGASLGDYAALYAAGVLSASDSLFLAGRRAELPERKCEMDIHAMLAIRATEVEVLEESISGEEWSIVIQSDLMQPEFFEAANGNRMNGHGVVTSSTHVDIALTLAKHLYNRIRPGSKPSGIDIRNLRVLQSLVLLEDKTIPQRIRLQWYNVLPNSENLEYGFASAEVEFGDS
ncbi:hypothetical protein APSETT445_000290 [Aspergillus pseudonomiae]